MSLRAMMNYSCSCSWFIACGFDQQQQTGRPFPSNKSQSHSSSGNLSKLKFCLTYFMLVPILCHSCFMPDERLGESIKESKSFHLLFKYSLHEFPEDVKQTTNSFTLNIWLWNQQSVDPSQGSQRTLWTLAWHKVIKYQYISLMFC